MNDLNSFTIVSLTYHNDAELQNTVNSIKPLIKLGCKHLICDGSKRLKTAQFDHNPLIIYDNGKGIYDAINESICKCDTKYLMLLHSGDEFISDITTITKIIHDMDNQELDLSLNNSLVPFFGKHRKHRADIWFPWMFKFGVQPPHLATIFRLSYIRNFTYKTNLKIIADFVYFTNLFNHDPRYLTNNLYLVKMASGGKTTSGIKSVIDTSFEFISEYGIIKGFFMAVFRIPLKLIQAF